MAAMMSEMSLAQCLVKADAHLTDDEVRVARSNLETLQRAGVVSVAQLVEAVTDATTDLPVRLIGCRFLA